MLKSYKFESRPIDMQVVEQETGKVPFAIAQPADTAISESKPRAFAAKFTKESRATRTMMWLWTGDATVDGEGYRVLGTGQKGTLSFSAAHRSQLSGGDGPAALRHERQRQGL